MIIKIGETIDYGGKQFVVVLLNQEEALEGGVLLIRALDPEMASREQQKAIKVEQTSNQMLDMVKKLTEGGAGGFGGMNFGG